MSSLRTGGDPSEADFKVAIATPNSTSVCSLADNPDAASLHATDLPNFFAGLLDPVVPRRVPRAYMTEARTSGTVSV